MSNENLSRYYFVALGRERGGFLDILGLPANASEVEVGNAERTYLIGVQKEHKTARKVLKESLKQNSITQEEFDAEAKKLEDTENEKKMILNKKKETWKTLSANARERERMGVRVTFSPWASMYQDIGGNPQTFWQLLSCPGPIPGSFENSKPGLTARLSAAENLLTAALIGEDAAPSDHSVPISAVLMRAAVDYNLLQYLRRADARWKQIGGTNRSYWSRMVETAAVEEKPPAVKGAVLAPHADEIPTLGIPTNLSIEKLEREPLQETDVRPRRRTEDMIDDELKRSFLAALLGQAGQGANAGNRQDADVRPMNVDFDELMQQFLLALNLQQEKERV